MHQTHIYYPDCPEAYIVGLARTGDRQAFDELVRRRQSSVRNLMRRCCNDVTLADDLAQQVFLKVWLNIRTLREASAFGGWLKRLAISIWLQYLRKNDALNMAREFDDNEPLQHDSASVGMDLDHALQTLPDHVRLCIVLAYNEGMTHQEIAEVTKIPLGTVKSHINRGAARLKNILAAYTNAGKVEK